VLTERRMYAEGPFLDDFAAAIHVQDLLAYAEGPFLYAEGPKSSPRSVGTLEP
jgi:hypothetical protein